MAKTRADKEVLKDNVAVKFQKANAAIIAEYRGLSMADLTELRSKLREVNAEFKIVKNRVAKKAIELDSPASAPLSPSLKGPVGVIFIYGDPAQAAKSVLEFGKDREKFKVTSGMLEGASVTAQELKAIADLPPMDVLIAKIIGSMVSPHRGLVGILNALPRSMVCLLNAIKEKKESEGAS